MEQKLEGCFISIMEAEEKLDIDWNAVEESEIKNIKLMYIAKAEERS